MNKENIEIELSAEELRNVSQPRMLTRVITATRDSGDSHVTKARFSRPAIEGLLASALVAVACGAVWALTANAPKAVDPPPVVAAAAFEKPVIPRPAPPQGPPVRIRNPFDKSEFFEFPPGTSDEEAHAAVADALMHRAMERRAELDARPSKRRRAG